MSTQFIHSTQSEVRLSNAQTSNPSIERTTCGRLRLPTAAAHVERWAAND